MRPRSVGASLCAALCAACSVACDAGAPPERAEPEPPPIPMVADRYLDGYPDFHELIRAHTWKILHEAEHLQLHSLNPFRRAVGRAQLQGIAVEHSVELEPGPDREALLATLFDDVAMGFGAPCFRPEHAISATLGAQSVELLLDYACGRVVLIGPAGQTPVAGKLRDSGRQRLEQLLGQEGPLAR